VSTLSFDNPYRHGFIRAAVCIPHVRVADPVFNAERTVAMARKASERGAAVTLFPELGLSGYSCDDLFHQSALLDSVEESLGVVVAASQKLQSVLLVGLPLRVEHRLLNVCAVVHGGKVLGLVPKTYLPNYREFYEKRQFASGRDVSTKSVYLLGEEVLLGSDLVFCCENLKDFALYIEICEDVWTPAPPSTFGALAGATVLANLSASNITVGKAEYRRALASGQSARCLAAYLYSAAGPGESTTDLAWDGHALIYENGEKLAESERFSSTEDLILADIDVQRLVAERLRQTSFADTAHDWKERVGVMRRVPFTLDVPSGALALERAIERFPFVPSDAHARDERCYEAYNIQVAGLTKRLQQSGVKKLVLGVSGGLDSTHALIVACRAMDALNLPRTNILGYTMPGFATSDRTLQNAHALMDSLGITASELDIKPSCVQMLQDLGHPFASGEPVYDVTFENVQAGERTNHLFRLANHHGGLVLGTGDLSELALGWCTYGVGDHMSHYNVNASVPKTLIQYLIRWVAASDQFGSIVSDVLVSIADTEISPELVPGAEGGGAQPGQKTEEKIGPYKLQDFHLYYLTRFGLSPSKILYLCHQAWGEQFEISVIEKWLELFLKRFFQNQFKRSCVPNGPKVGSGGSLSPRGDWRMPSDAEATAWLDELRRNGPSGPGDGVK
jgi:NAD+ synthase (glutamine-hydrolysing)